jgi:uncharacterized lipoprotein YddW (UPF0748 family)
MDSRAGHRVSRRSAPRPRLVLAALAMCMAPVVWAADEPQRAFWMPAASLESIEGVRRVVAAAAMDGFNTILAPISLAPDVPGTFDGMAETLKEAEARQLRVFARLDVARAAGSDEIPAARDHLLYRHPDWLMVPRDIAIDMWRVDLRSPEYIGRLGRWTRANAERIDGLYVSPLHPEAIAYLTDRVTTVLRRYAVDGVHLDEVRFPDADFDYSRRALDLFRADVRRGLEATARTRMDGIEAIDPFAYPEEFPERWRRFRQARLTDLVSRLRTAIRGVRPEAIVSVGVTFDADLALGNHLQDWRAWLEGRFVDAVARVDSAARVVVFSYENVLRPLAPVISTSQNTAAGGAP